MTYNSVYAYKCMVLGCLSTEGHSFPADADQRQKWLKVLALEDCSDAPTAGSFVCSKHFLPGDHDGSAIDLETGDYNLKPDAVPTLELHDEDGVKSARGQLLPVKITNLCKSSCRICNHKAEQILQCSECERHIQVRCAGRAPMVLLGLDYLKSKCCKEAAASCESDVECLSATAESAAELSVSSEPETVEAKASGIETVVVDETEISKLHGFLKSNSTSFASSANQDEFVIPVEEVIIKEEPDDSLDYTLGPFIANVCLPSTSQKPVDQIEQFKKKPLPAKYHTAFDAKQRGGVVLRSSPKPRMTPKRGGEYSFVRTSKKNKPRGFFVSDKRTFQPDTTDFTTKDVKNQKRNLQDFTREGMKNPRNAMQFYDWAQQLLQANISLSKQNEALLNEVKTLKKKISQRCERCKRIQSGMCVELPSAKNGLKRKAESESKTFEAGLESTEPHEIVSIPREPAPNGSPVRERNAVVPPTTTKNKFDFGGPYRIAALEYFVAAISGMHYSHFLSCSGKMTLHSETLLGTSGRWTFSCNTCKRAKTVLTEPKRPVAPSYDCNPWLKWLGSLPPRQLGYARSVFEHLRVPFFYDVTPETLEVVARQRTIIDPDRSGVFCPSVSNIDI